MDWKIIFETIVPIVGILMSLGYYPQVYKILKNKSVKDISTINYIILSFGTAVWTLYGIYLKSWTIFLSFIAGLIGSWTVLILILIYRKKNKKTRKK